MILRRKKKKPSKLKLLLGGAVDSPGRPLPEMVDPRHRSYDYIDSTDMSWLPTNGMTDMVNGLLVAPLGDRATIRHELAHTKWSTARFPKIEYDARVFQAVEDGRINSGMADIGLPIEFSDDSIQRVLELVGDDLKRGDRALVCLRCVAGIGTNALEPMLEFIHRKARLRGRKIRRLVEQVRDELLNAAARRDAPVATWQEARAIGERLAKELGLDRPGPRDGEPVGCCLAMGGDITGSAREDRDVLEGTRLGEGGCLPPGRMKIRKVPLVEPCGTVSQRRKRRWVATSEGAVLRYIDRYLVDQAVFRRAKRAECGGGGTALIDASGSMSLSVEDVEKIVTRSPAGVTVAVYSGSGGDGELRVVARGGKRASARNLKPKGGGNIVDAPALEWLATQPEPRVWMSDGGVTGVGDMPSPVVTQRCDSARTRGRIRHVKDIDKVVAALGGR